MYKVRSTVNALTRSLPATRICHVYNFSRILRGRNNLIKTVNAIVELKISSFLCYKTEWISGSISQKYLGYRCYTYYTYTYVYETVSKASTGVNNLLRDTCLIPQHYPGEFRDISINAYVIELVPLLQLVQLAQR